MTNPSIWAPGSAVDASTYIATESFTATASQTLFTLSSILYTPGTGALIVAVGGLVQVPGVDFTETSSGSFTFTTGAPEGAVVLVIAQTAITTAVPVVDITASDFGAHKFIKTNGAGNGFEGRTAAQVLSDIGAEPADATILKDADIGVSVQAYDADTLKADVADTVTVGYAATPYNAGTKSAGTFTPDEANGNLQYYTNNGAHTLAPPANNTSLVIQITNGASAGAITTSGFTKVTGTSPTTTNGDDFLAYITKINGFSHLAWQALQ